jgi:hypothetical protein
MISTMTNKLLAFALGAFLMSGCASQAPAPVDTTADETALREITVTWFKAYNAGDAETAAGLYAEDAVLMPPHAPVARGRAAIRAFIGKDSADSKAAGLTLVNGVEPSLQGSSNTVMARDFWLKSLANHWVSAITAFSPVHWNPRDSTTVVETLWRRSGAAARQIAESRRWE